MIVTIYTSPTCQYCKLAKQFLKRNRIRCNERSVTNMNIAQEMADRTRQTAVPVLIIEEKGIERIVIGFQEQELKAIFGIS